MAELFRAMKLCVMLTLLLSRRRRRVSRIGSNSQQDGQGSEVFSSYRSYLCECVALSHERSKTEYIVGAHPAAIRDGFLTA